MKELKILQIIQKLTLHLKQCKSCIAGFALFMLVVLPYNIQSACSSNVSMDGYKLANAKTIYFSWDISPIPFTIVINGIKYASPKVSDGLFDGLTQYHICTTSKGEQLYFIRGKCTKNICQ